jgi:hypothetical protein
MKQSILIPFIFLAACFSPASLLAQPAHPGLLLPWNQAPAVATARQHSATPLAYGELSC